MVCVTCDELVKERASRYTNSAEDSHNLWLLLIQRDLKKSM